MTLLFCDGFDLDDSLAAATSKWGTGSNGGGGFAATGGMSFATGRTGTGRSIVYNYSAFNGNDSSPSLQFRMNASSSTVFLGFAYNYSSGENRFFHLLDSAGGIQLSVSLNGTLNPQVNLGNGGTLLCTSSTPVTINLWTFIELGIVIDPTVGSITIKQNGVTTGTFSGNTRATANSNVQYMFLGSINASPSTGGIFSYDDFYLCNAAGSVNNTFLGDIRIFGILPNAVGTNTVWTRVGGAASNWQSVNEHPPDNDTTAVKSSTINQIDTYNFTDLPSNTSSVLAVASYFSARKDDAGSRVITCRVRSAGTEADAPGSVLLNLTYTMSGQIMEVNPVSTTAWTVSDVNNAEFGPRLVS